MGLISSLFGGKTSQGTPAETRRKTTKSEKQPNKPNKLSKPRTNTSTNNLRSLQTGGTSGRSSIVDVNARGKRSSSVPGRNDGLVASAEYAGVDPELGRGRQGERDKRASTLSGLFRSKSSTPCTTTELQERPDNQWPLGASGEDESLKSSELLHRHSQLGLPSHDQELPADSQLPTADNPPSLHRTPSYVRFHQARLSLVAEAPHPTPTPDSQHLQRLADTEAILTGGESVHSRNSNTSKRLSMVSSSSPALPVRTNSTEPVHVQPENQTQYPIRRRSHLTPGVATRVDDVNHTAHRSNILRKPNPKARRQSAAAPETNQMPYGRVERSKTLPSEEEIHGYYYDQVTLRDDPLKSRQIPAPLQKPRFKENSMDMQRMSTPTDLRHIGSFELGSLRITNGAAISSATNTPRAQQKPVREPEMSDISPPTTPMANVDKRQPRKQGHSQQTRLLEIGMDSAGPGTESAFSNTDTAIKQSLYPDKLAVSSAPSRHLETAPQIPGGADKFADFYRLDIDFLSNPFTPDTSTPSSPKLEATSKHMAEQDELFEDETMSPLKSGSEGVERPSHLTRTMITQKDDLRLPDTAHASQQRPTLTKRSSGSTSQGMLTMNDSGYNSYASLGSDNSLASQSKPREASESPTPSGGPDSATPVEPDVSLTSFKPRLPKADFWKTQHAPNIIAKESRKEPALSQEVTTLPLPLGTAPSSSARSQMPMPPIPTTVARGDSLVPQAEAEVAEAAGNTESVPLKRSSRLQHRNTSRILQNSSELRPNSVAPQRGLGSDDSTTPVKKKKWQRNSTRSSFEATIAVQGVIEPEGTKVPPVPKRLSVTFKERAIKFSGLKPSTAKTDYVEAVAEKPPPPPPTEEVQRSIRRKSSLVTLSASNLVIATPFDASESTTSLHKQVPSKSKALKSITITNDDKEHQARKTFERHITAPATIANSLGASPYDAASSAMGAPQHHTSNQPSSAGGKPASGRPRRDRTGRIIGMDEESASNYARARSQVRAQDAERREALLTGTMQNQLPSQDGRGPTPMSNSSFANQLAIQSQRTAVKSTSDNLPPVPSISIQDVKRQIPVKGKRENLGPPPTMLNDRNRKGVLGFWDSPGRAADVDAQLDPSNRSGSAGSVRSAFSEDGSPVASIKRVGFVVASPTANLPSMAPQWKGPSPKELAEMALAAKKEGRTSVDAQRRSMSANGVYDKKSGVMTSSRPSSVMSEREGGRKRGWGFRGRKGVEA